MVTGRCCFGPVAVVCQGESTHVLFSPAPMVLEIELRASLMLACALPLSFTSSPYVSF
jgi:hypothetical protein